MVVPARPRTPARRMLLLPAAGLTARAPIEGPPRTEESGLTAWNVLSHVQTAEGGVPVVIAHFKTPSPEMFSAPKLPSPVPTYTVVQTLAPHVVGSTASEPTAIVGIPLLAGLSVSGVHVVPPSVVTQRPPSAPPR